MEHISPFPVEWNSTGRACPFRAQLVTYSPELLITKGTAQLPITIVQIRLPQPQGDVKQNKAPSFSLPGSKSKINIAKGCMPLDFGQRCFFNTISS